MCIYKKTQIIKTARHRKVSRSENQEQLYLKKKKRSNKPPQRISKTTQRLPPFVTCNKIYRTSNNGSTKLIKVENNKRAVYTRIHKPTTVFQVGATIYRR